MFTGFLSSFLSFLLALKRALNVPSLLLKDWHMRLAVNQATLTLTFSAEELGAVLTPIRVAVEETARDAEVSSTFPICQPPTMYAPKSL